MANPNRTAYLARQPRTFVMVSEDQFNTRMEAETAAESLRVMGKHVRVARLTMGPRKNSIYRFFVRVYEHV